MIEAMLQSALRSAELAELTGLAHDRIVISAKVSGVRDLVDVYRLLAARCDYPLHLGLTEAGMGMKGTVGVHGRPLDPAERGHRRHDPRLAHAGARRRPHRGSADRAAGAPVAGDALVPAAGLGVSRLRPHHQHVLPGHGAAHPGLPPGADAGLGGRYPGVEEMRVAVMGCVVNGPGESKHADIGISACPARSRSRSRRSSWTARCAPRSAATSWWTSSSPSWTTTLSAATARPRPRRGRVGTPHSRPPKRRLRPGRCHR